MNRAMAEFHIWWEEKQGIVAEVVKVLNRELADEANRLRDQVVEIERYHGYLHTLLARANNHLDKCSAEALINLRGTAVEKRVYMDDQVADVREVRDVLEGVLKTIQARMSFAQTWLNYIKTLPQV